MRRCQRLPCDVFRQSAGAGGEIQFCRALDGHSAARLSIKGEDEQRRALEKQAVLVSLDNLMSFPFVKDAVEQERLTLHGLWTDVGEGGLFQYEPEDDTFVAI